MPIDLTHGFQFGAFVAEPLKGCVTDDDGQPRHLPPKAMAVLVSLAEAAPEPLTRDELIDKVWGERCVSDEVLTHAITELRHALGDTSGKSRYIQTIPKCGYRLLRGVRPVSREVRPGEGGGHSAPANSAVAVGIDSIRRHPTTYLVLLGGFTGTLGALYYLNAGNEGDSLPPIPELSRPGAEDMPGHSAASEYLLRAESLERRTTPENIRQAEILLEQAVAMDSTLVPAWALLGRIYYRQTRLFRTRPLEGAELARQAIQTALAIDPKFGPAHADLALINMTFDFDFDRAFQHLQQAQDLNPTDSQVLRVAARMEMTHAHVDHAIDLLERAARMDPYSCMGHADLGQAYYFAGRLKEAEDELDESLTLNPDVVRSRYLLGLVRLANNAEELALAAMEDEPDEGFRMAGIALVRFALDDSASSDEALDEIKRSQIGPRPYSIATAYAFRGQNDEALSWLEKAYEQRDGDLVFLLVDPLLAGLRSRESWQQLVEKLGLPHRT